MGHKRMQKKENVPFARCARVSVQDPILDRSRITAAILDEILR